MNRASPFQNSVSTSGPSNSSNPREASLSFSRARNVQYGLPLPSGTRVGGTSMLYRRNCTVFHEPVFSISGVSAPASSPVAPAFFSAAAASSPAFAKVNVVSSRSTRRNRLPAAPRFLACDPASSFSSAVSVPSSSGAWARASTGTGAPPAAAASASFPSGARMARFSASMASTLSLRQAAERRADVLCLDAQLPGDLGQRQRAVRGDQVHDALLVGALLHCIPGRSR